MPIQIIDHPIARVLISQLRNKKTSSEAFRAASRKITQVLILEATRTLQTDSYFVETPIEEATGYKLSNRITFVPIIRAGISMVEPALDMIPGATVGYVGLERDEETAIARTYYKKLPRLSGQKTFIIDPMLATGGSTLQAIELCKKQNSEDITVISIISAPEGIAAVKACHPEINIYTAALDRELNEKKFILPGLGDFGDRLYNT
jgi:uracil phosphoribosyltransferase